MAVITVKGHEFDVTIVKDSFSRRAVQFKNNIIHTLKKIGLTEDDMDIQLEACAFKKAPASVTWYFDGYRMYYSYDLSDKFVDNLNIVSKVIELEVDALIHERKIVEDFISAFSEDNDVEEQRKEARIALGLNIDVKDLGVINKRYKALAREYHPDMPAGNIGKFKAINHAHKIIKRELE